MGWVFDGYENYALILEIGVVPYYIDYIAELSEVIRRLHGVESKHVESVSVKELLEGDNLWEGTVEVFELIGHAVADQQDAQQKFRFNRRPARLAVGILQLLADEIEVDVPVDETKQVVFRKLIYNAEIIEQRLETGMVSHHMRQASVKGDKKEHRPNT